MLQPRQSNRRKGEPVTRRGISLPPSEDERLVALADKHYGGNVSLLIRKLVEMAWDREAPQQEAQAA